jgi:hypothetical protein
MPVRPCPSRKRSGLPPRIRSGLRARLHRAEDRWISPLRARLVSPAIRRPVFVIAPPRSGSTLLFDCLVRAPELTAFTHREAEHIWWRVKPYSSRSALSDALSPAEVDRSQRNLAKVLFYVESTRHTAVREGRRRSLAELLCLRPIRYLDKTISNCFHIQLLGDMFPDAKLVFLVRDPRANISSMIAGWPELRFGKAALTPTVQAAKDASIPHWTYPAPPGWTDVLDWPLHRICAWSWQQHVEAMLDGIDQVDARLLHFETTLTGEADHELRDLFTWLDLSWTPDVQRFLDASPVSRTAVSPPAPEKWRQHEGEIAEVWPMIAETARRIGLDHPV